jgi:hypothetical protein
MIFTGIFISSVGNHFQIKAQWKLNPETDSIAELDKEEYPLYYPLRIRRKYSRIGMILLISGPFLTAASIALYLSLK